MRAGRLDRLIDIQRKGQTQSESGDPVDAWTTIVARRPASYRPIRGDERYEAPQIVSSEQVEFRIRYSENVADLTPLDRIIYPAMGLGDSAIPANRIFDVLALPEVGRQEGIAIIAQRRPDVSA